MPCSGTGLWHGEGVHPDEPRARFESLARGLMEPLRRFLARRTDPETAEDVLADTLLVCWRRLDDVPGETADEALPWAYAVARGCLANAERGVRRQARLAARIATVDPPRETAPDPIESGDPEADLDEALETLPAAQGEVLRLWAWEDLGAGQIAEVLGISPNAASLRLHRARQGLRQALAQRKIPGGAGPEQAEDRRR